MKVLLLIDSLVAGGRERRLIELIKGFRKDYTDIELHLVVFKEKIHYKEVYDLGIPVEIMKRVPKKNPKVFFQLYKLCKTFKPDLIHSWGTMSAILAIPASTLLNIKLINGNIVDSPNHLKFYHKLLFRARLTYPFSSVVVSNSLAGLKSYRVPKKKGVCIYNGFDGNRISNVIDPAEVKKKFNVLTQKAVGMVGSFSERKDYKTYLEAALLLLKRRDDVSFLSVGDGPDLEKCQKMIPQEHKARCIFTGLQRDVESIINMIDIGVLSTNTKVHGEGISNAILEYMALKKPTVATRGGGTNEAVDDKKTGFLVHPESAEDMADRLNYLLDNPDEAKAMGLQARQRMEKLFLLDRMTVEYYELYTKVLKGHL
jgi:glycosyltransferase involved in cell wall biosynthesis